MHCDRHVTFHAACADCQRKRRGQESEGFDANTNSALLSDLAVANAAESLTVDTSIPDSSSSGFNSDTNSGGDFGGGGAGGDY